jgi:phosphoglycolate phosphatase
MRLSWPHSSAMMEQAQGAAGMAFSQITAILFDKDGTLFDFSASWSGWALGVIEGLSGGNAAQKARLAEALHFDLGVRQFHPSSPVIAGTLEESADLMMPHLPHLTFEALVAHLLQSSKQAEMIAPLPLSPLLEGLAQRGYLLGVATNDGAASAHAHLNRAGILGHFAHVLGYDSGYTPKPAPDMLLGFAALAGLAPERVVMVGDSTHDLIAGRAAGMATIGVLTGMAAAADLAPHADLVLPDIGHLPQVLAGAA